MFGAPPTGGYPGRAQPLTHLPLPRSFYRQKEGRFVLGRLSAQPPAAGRTALAALVAAERPSIEELFNKVLALPGVAAIAKPAIDKFRSELDALTKG